jgi:hypothetical protein
MDLVALMVLGLEGQEIELLLNPNAIVTIQKESKGYTMHLFDGRTFRLTKKQYTKQFFKNS